MGGLPDLGSKVLEIVVALVSARPYSGQGLEVQFLRGLVCIKFICLWVGGTRKGLRVKIHVHPFLVISEVQRVFASGLGMLSQSLRTCAEKVVLEMKRKGP